MSETMQRGATRVRENHFGTLMQSVCQAHQLLLSARYKSAHLLKTLRGYGWVSQELPEMDNLCDQPRILRLILRKLPAVKNSMATYAALSRALVAASHRSRSLEDLNLDAVFAPHVPPFLEAILWHPRYGRVD